MCKLNTDPLRDVQQEEPAAWNDGNEVYEWEMEFMNGKWRKKSDTVRN